MARNQWEPALALTWMPWKSCCSSSQSRRQSPSGPGGGGCIAAGPRAGGAESRIASGGLTPFSPPSELQEIPVSPRLGGPLMTPYNH